MPENGVYAMYMLQYTHNFMAIWEGKIPWLTHRLTHDQPMDVEVINQSPSNEAVGIAHGGEDQTTEKVGEVGCLAAIFRSNWMVPKGKRVIFPSVFGDCWRGYAPFSDTPNRTNQVSWDNVGDNVGWSYVFFHVIDMIPIRIWKSIAIFINMLIII